MQQQQQHSINNNNLGFSGENIIFLDRYLGWHSSYLHQRWDKVEVEEPAAELGPSINIDRNATEEEKDVEKKDRSAAAPLSCLVQHIYIWASLSVNAFNARVAF